MNKTLYRCRVSSQTQYSGQRHHMTVSASQITDNPTVCSQFVQACNKENIRAPLYRPLCAGNPPVASGFPSQRSGNGCREFPWEIPAMLSLNTHGPVDYFYIYRQISNIRRTKSPNLHVFGPVLWLSLLTTSKPDVKSRMKMYTMGELRSTLCTKIPLYVRSGSDTKQMPLEHLSYTKETSWNTSGRT